ncbi:hypothetical protein ES703_12545 [subsurface metagenome]
MAVGDHEGESTDGGRAVGHDGVCKADYLAPPHHYQPDDYQVEQHDRQGAGNGGNDIHPGADVTEQGQDAEQASHEQKERAAGRMGYAHDVGGGNKLAAVPEGGRGRHGLQVQKERK